MEKVEILEITVWLQDNATSIVLRVNKTNGQPLREICEDVIKRFREAIANLEAQDEQVPEL